MAHPKHQEVRQLYQYCCGYCGVSETDTGGELTVDHYYPVASGGDDRDENLVYACHRCNLYKSDIIEEIAASGQALRLLHPLLDDRNLHVQEHLTTGRLEPLTDRGRFHITILRLNRAELIAHRQKKQMIQFLLARHEIYVQEIAQLRQEIETRNRLIDQMQTQLWRETDPDT